MSIGSERKADSALQELKWGEFYTSRFGRYSARLIEQAREAARSLRKFPNRGRVFRRRTINRFASLCQETSPDLRDSTGPNRDPRIHLRIPADSPESSLNPGNQTPRPGGCSASNPPRIRRGLIQAFKPRGSMMRSRMNQRQRESSTFQNILGSCGGTVQ